MSHVITQMQNFCRVFELPLAFPSGYCFGGGYNVDVRMVDWFNPIPLDAFRDSELSRDAWLSLIPRLTEFVLAKNYVRDGRKYLILTDFDEAIVIQRPLEE